MMNSRKQEGFKVARRTAKIDFAEGSPWHGVEATVIISVPFETLFWYQKNAEHSDATTRIMMLAQAQSHYGVSGTISSQNGTYAMKMASLTLQRVRE
jgi:hypothetical protein